MSFVENAVSPGRLSAAARERLLSDPREPLFVADWERVLMIHFEVDGDELQRNVPFPIDLRDGRAFVSLVAFTMRKMRPRLGGKLAGWLFQPIASHEFFNVRTYIRHGNETGIYFLTEWLANWFAVQLGPISFGLPYRYGKIVYEHDWKRGDLSGCVTDAKSGASVNYRRRRRKETHFNVELETRNAESSQSLLTSSPTGSLTEWLMERYSAFTCRGRKRRFFYIWHQPWPQCEVEIELTDDSLLKENWPWFADARLVGANFSPGVRDVWMGWPHRIP